MAAAKWHEGLTAKHGQVLVASFMGWVFDGYETYALIVVLGPALGALLTPEQAAAHSLWAGIAVGVTLFGWGIGGLIGGVLADYIGRKRMMLISMILYALFSAITAFSQTIGELIALRFLTGLALGSEWSTGIALIAETWPERARAKGAGFLQSGFGWGGLLAALVWLVISYLQPLGDGSWRLMFVIGALPALLSLYVRRNLDESERWQQAVAEKRWSTTEAEVDRAAAADDKRPFTLTEIFRQPESRRRVLLTSALSMVTMVGWYGVSTWLPSHTAVLAKAQGLQDPSSWGAWIGTLYMLGAIVAYLLSGFLIDAIGRRSFLWLTYAGSLVMAPITYGLTTTATAMQIVAPINGFFTLGLAFSWMAIYPAELFTSTVRTTAASFIFNASRLVAGFFPIIAGSIIGGLGGVVTAALIISTVYVLGLVLPLWLPETRGKGLPG